MQFRCLLAGVALTLGGSTLAACNGDDDSATPLTSEPSTADASTTTATTAPTTSTTLDFETEVKLAALELIELRNEVFQNPDEARVDEYIHELCACREAELGFVREFVANGSAWSDPPIEPLGIRLDNPDPGGPSFALVARQPHTSIVGPNGSTTIPAVDVAPYYVALARDDEGHWRLNALQAFPSMSDEVAQRIVDEDGLP